MLPSQLPATFSTKTTVVQVAVTVEDRTGQAIPNLEQTAFRLFDEKQMVSIAVFAHVVVPPPTIAAVNQVPEARTLGNAVGHPYNRVVWIVFDDLHASAVRVPAAKAIARQLVNQWIGPGDLIGVRQVEGSSGQPTVLASDRPAAMKAIDDFASRAQPALEDEEEVNRVGDLMQTLAAIADGMRTVTDRRVALLLISEGVDYDIFNVRTSGAVRVRESSEAAITALRSANVVLYAIDPRGLVSTEGEVVEHGSSGAGGSSVDAALADASNRLSLSRLSLRHMAEETGGFASTDSNDFQPAIDRIGRQISDYYLLGFVPADRDCKSGVRRLRVKANVRGARVRGRSAYVCKSM
jgi:VWFA-related protein